MQAVQDQIATVGARTAYIVSFNTRHRDEFFNGEIFYALAEARVEIES